MEESRPPRNHRREAPGSLCFQCLYNMDGRKNFCFMREIFSDVMTMELPTSSGFCVGSCMNEPSSVLDEEDLEDSEGDCKEKRYITMTTKVSIQGAELFPKCREEGPMCSWWTESNLQ